MELRLSTWLQATAALLISSTSSGWAQSPSNELTLNQVRLHALVQSYTDHADWVVEIASADDGAIVTIDSIELRGGKVTVDTRVLAYGSAGNSSDRSVNLTDFFHDNLAGTFIRGGNTRRATKIFQAFLRSRAFKFRILCHNLRGESSIDYRILKNNQEIYNRTGVNRRVCSNTTGDSGGTEFEIIRIDGAEFLKLNGEF
ncbi:hypothetical protein [Oceaniradius stylonematis]|uniref:hypothetical protein n=1 Tax=Oceaniradius stylonematis TaxID=2184161 RepID=UPI00273FC66F|nr:hypothetical protein [Oceaniradius stylonematis]